MCLTLTVSLKGQNPCLSDLVIIIIIIRYQNDVSVVYVSPRTTGFNPISELTEFVQEQTS